MKRGIVLILALAIVLVFALGAVAVAAPDGGANSNPLGMYRSDNVPGYDKPLPFGQAQSAFVALINSDAGFYWDVTDETYYNYGSFLKAWKAEMGFKQ